MGEGEKTNIITHSYHGRDYVIEVRRSEKLKGKSHATRVLGRVEEFLGRDYQGEDENLVRLRQGSIDGIYAKVEHVNEQLENEILREYNRSKGGKKLNFTT